MASIVSSSVVWADIQTDGRFVVRELWLDDQGNDFVFDYIAPQGADINATMTARTPQVLADAQIIQAQNGLSY